MPLDLRLEQRPQASAAWRYGAPLLAIAITLCAGAALFAVLGYPPAHSLKVFFIDPVSSVEGLAELALKATPLMLCAVGLSIGFRANVWNIGAEGQFVVGALAGGGLCLALQGDGGGWWLLPLMVVAGVLGGMAWAAIPAFLRTRFNANEILVSLMLTYVAVLLLQFLVHGPWKDPAGFNFPQSEMFAEGGLLPVLVEGTRLNLGTLVALAILGLAWAVLTRGLFGFQIRVIGQAPLAAAYAGFDQRRMIWASLLLSGALAGLAGVFEIAGPVGQLTPAIPQNYGFTAIIVAFLGRLHPVGILLGSLVIALSYLGGESAQILLRLPVAVAGVFQGMLLFFLLACDVLIRYRIRLGHSVRRTA